jgi:hypothetical protein
MQECLTGFFLLAKISLSWEEALFFLLNAAAQRSFVSPEGVHLDREVGSSHGLVGLVFSVGTNLGLVGLVFSERSSLGLVGLRFSVASTIGLEGHVFSCFLLFLTPDLGTSGDFLRKTLFLSCSSKIRKVEFTLGLND